MARSPNPNFDSIRSTATRLNSHAAGAARAYGVARAEAVGDACLVHDLGQAAGGGDGGLLP